MSILFLILFVLVLFFLIVRAYQRTEFSNLVSFSSIPNQSALLLWQIMGCLQLIRANSLKLNLSSTDDAVSCSVKENLNSALGFATLFLSTPSLHLFWINVKFLYRLSIRYFRVHSDDSLYHIQTLQVDSEAKSPKKPSRALLFRIS